MKLFGQVAVHVRGEEIHRRPGFLDKIRRAFGGEPDLRTGQMRASLEATAVVDAVRDALRSIGVNNAISLVLDDIVLFHDREGRPDDLGDLFLAFHEQSAALGGAGFALLRLTVEHLEAGLHLVLEVQARSEHAVEDAAVRVIVSGRLKALEPQKGEDADAYRARVEPIAKDAGALEVARVQFESFVERVRDAIATAMPEARVEVRAAEARVEKPSRRPDQRRPEAQDPRSRNYDPYAAHYGGPLDGVMSMLMWTSIFSMMMPPHYVVVDHHNDPTGGFTDNQAEFHDTGDVGDAHDVGDAGDVDVGSDIGDVGSDFGDFGGFDW